MKIPHHWRNITKLVLHQVSTRSNITFLKKFKYLQLPPGGKTTSVATRTVSPVYIQNKVLNPKSQALLTQLLCGCQQISPSCCIRVTQASLAYSLICCVSSWQQALVSSCFIPPVLLNHLFYGSPYILHDFTQYNKTLLLQKHYLTQFHLYLNS